MLDAGITCGVQIRTPSSETEPLQWKEPGAVDRNLQCKLDYYPATPPLCVDGRARGTSLNYRSSTTIGVWSEGRSWARGPLSISHDASRAAAARDNKK